MEMELIIGKKFVFDAGHFLPEHQGKCKNLHGHTYTLIIEIHGKIKDNGMVMDYHLLSDIVEEHVLQHLDHKCLNDVLTHSPTCENTIAWIVKQLRTKLHLQRIELHEGDGGYAIWQKKT